MPLDFPSAPNVGDSWTGSNGVEYVWDGTKWVAAGVGGGSGAFATKPYVDARIVSVLDHGAFGNGVTDDTAAIQNTLSTYAGKAIVWVPDTGSNYMVNPLVLPTGTHLIIDGTLMLRPGNTNGVLVLQNVSNVTISGHGTVDGNGTVQGAVAAGLNAGNCTNVSVSGITLQNARTWNFNVTQSSHFRVTGVRMLGATTANEFAQGCDDCWITGCHINGPANDEGFSFYGGVTNSGAIGNTVTNAGADGISVLADASQPAQCRNIVISNNVCHDCFGAGIGVDNGVGATGQHQNITISNNQVYSNNRNNAPNAAQLYVDCAIIFSISNNSVGQFGTTVTDYGIWTGNRSTGATITGNVIADIGSSTRPGLGIYVNFTNVVLVDGNTFQDYRPTGYMTAIGGAAGILNRFTNNLFGNLAAGSAITIAPQPDTVIQGVPRVNAANDAAAAAAGVLVGNEYRNGSVMMVRVA